MPLILGHSSSNAARWRDTLGMGNSRKSDSKASGFSNAHAIRPCFTLISFHFFLSLQSASRSDCRVFARYRLVISVIMTPVPQLRVAEIYGRLLCRRRERVAARERERERHFDSREVQSRRSPAHCCCRFDLL